jgi:hypothetical protein
MAKTINYVQYVLNTLCSLCRASWYPCPSSIRAWWVETNMQLLGLVFVYINSLGWLPMNVHIAAQTWPYKVSLRRSMEWGAEWAILLHSAMSTLCVHNYGAASTSFLLLLSHCCMAPPCHYHALWIRLQLAPVQKMQLAIVLLWHEQACTCIQCRSCMGMGLECFAIFFVL